MITCKDGCDLFDTMPQKPIVFHIDDEEFIHQESGEILGEKYDIVPLDNIPSLGLKIFQLIHMDRREIAAILTDQDLPSIFVGNSLVSRMNPINNAAQQRGLQPIPLIVVSGGVSKTALAGFQSSDYYAGSIDKKERHLPIDLIRQMESRIFSWRQSFKKSA